MTPEIICTDLDRTLIPNGAAPESDGARATLARVVDGHGLKLAYVSGRHLDLVLGAIGEWGLPVPDFAICDVGSTIQVPGEGQWTALESWAVRLEREWPMEVREAVGAAAGAIAGIHPQAPERQSRFKLSFFVDDPRDPARIRAAVGAHLADLPARAVFSVDETSGTGLLDILPVAAGKRGAIEHLLEHTGIEARRALFAGDSGNDLEVLGGPIPAVLVANATDAVREEARQLAAREDTTEQLYFARGGIHGMNGNYAAGILEGLAHFWPPTADWLR